MLGCQIEITLPGLKKTFNNQRELDEWLLHNHKRVGLSLAGIENVRFSKGLDNQGETFEVLRNFKNERAAVIRYDQYGTKVEELVASKASKGFKGVSRVIADEKTASGKFVFTPFNIDDFKRFRIKQYQDGSDSTGAAMSEAEAIQTVSVEIDSFSNISATGNEIHALADLYFTNLGKSKANVLATYRADNPDSKLSDSVLEVVYDVILKYHNKLKHQDPKMKFLTEVPIYDDESKILGIIDLIAVDSEGRAYITDFKSSYKALESWDRDKQNKYLYQLAFYKKLLEAKGVNVMGASILPMTMEASDATKSELVNLEVQEPVEVITHLASASSEASQVAGNHIQVKPLSSLEFENSGVIDKEQSAFFNISDSESFDDTYKKFIRPESGNIKSENGIEYFLDKYEKVWLKSTIRPALGETVEGNKSYNEGKIREYLIKRSAGMHEVISKAKDAMRRMEKSERGWYDPFGTFYRKVGDKSMPNATNTFSHYVNGAWDILDVPELESQGAIAFKNRISNYVDIVFITESDPFLTTKLAKGVNLVGEFRTDKERERQDSNLLATHANILGIKALSFLNNNIDLLRNEKITLNSIRVFNYEGAIQVELPKQKLITNYEILAYENGIKSNLRLIRHTDTLAELAYAVNRVVTGSNVSFKDLEFAKQIDTVISVKDPDKVSLRNSLIDIQKNLHYQMNIRSGTIDFNTPIGDLVFKLNNVLVNLAGLEVNQPTEDMRIVNLYDSTLFSSYHEIQHELARAALEPFRRAQNTLAGNFTKAFDDLRVIFQDFYKAQKVNRLIGNYQQSFNNLYERKDGKLDTNFRFKNPDAHLNDPNYLLEHERVFLRKILEIIGSRLYRVNLQNAIDTGDYFNVPLRKAGATSKVLEQGLWSAFNPIKNFYTNIVDSSMEQAEMLEEQQVDLNAAMDNLTEMYDLNSLNKNPLQRAKAIESRGGDLIHFEKNIELVVAELVFSDMKTEAYNRALPISNAVVVAGMGQAFKVGNFNIKNALDYINNYVKTSIFDQKLVEPKNESFTQKAAAFKHFVSMAQLGGNPLSGIREMLQGVWANFSKLAARQYGDETPSMKDYAWAINKIVGEGPEFINSVTKTEALNNLYRLANMDTNLMPEKIIVSKTGVTQLSNRWWLWFLGAPDYINRMTFLLAKMRKDGSYDAHTMDGENLKYDWRKDKRFEVYAKGDKSNPLYSEQRGLYLAHLEDFNKSYVMAGERKLLVEGDDLEMAYTSRERESIKQFVNYVHGAYDREDRIPFQHTIFGIFLMHFKTWLTAKKSQYFMRAGTYSIGAWGTKKSEITGNTLYSHIDADGVAYESEQEEGGTLIKEWQGKYMEGVYQSILRSGRAALSGKFDEAWDDNIRSNSIMLGLDTALFMLIGLGIKGIIDMGELEKDHKALAAVMHSVARSAEDLSAIENIGAIINPMSMFPMVNYYWSASEQMFGLMTGSTNLKRIVARTSGLGRAIDSTTHILETE